MENEKLYPEVLNSIKYAAEQRGGGLREVAAVK